MLQYIAHLTQLQETSRSPEALVQIQRDLWVLF